MEGWDGVGAVQQPDEQLPLPAILQLPVGIPGESWVLKETCGQGPPAVPRLDDAGRWEWLKRHARGCVKCARALAVYRERFAGAAR